MILGLPVHPLLVHFTITLLVLVPLAVLVSVAWPGMRRRLDWLLPLGAVAVGALAVAARQAGHALEQSLPVVLPAVSTHAQWGEWAMWSALGFAVVVMAWWASTTEQPLPWADKPFLRNRGVRRVLTVVVALDCVVTLVVATITGHLGAVAVWG